MTIEKIEYYDDKIVIIINDDIKQESLVVETNAGDFFDKLASAFYSTQAIKVEPIKDSE